MTVDTQMIMEKMKTEKITQTAIAEKLGCRICTVNLKMHGKASFTVEEMAVILKMLGMKIAAVSQDGEILEIIKTGG